MNLTTQSVITTQRHELHPNSCAVLDLISVAWFVVAARVLRQAASVPNHFEIYILLNLLDSHIFTKIMVNNVSGDGKADHVLFANQKNSVISYAHQ